MAPGYDSRQARTRLAGLTKPDPKERAAQIVAWAICWPWNLVWTLCVYNPFRYVGEFLLRELQSALFEISNGQFSGIEEDLTLAPPPPPYPVPAPATPAETTATPAETTAATSEPEAPNEPEAPKSTTVAIAATNTPPAPAEPVEQVTQINIEQTKVEQTTIIAEPEPATEDVAATAEASEPEAIEDLPEAVEAELAEGGSSDSYTWAPPEPTAFVPLSDRPLRAVKYEAGSAAPANAPEQTAPAGPAADPWFEKHAPNQ